MNWNTFFSDEFMPPPEMLQLVADGMIVDRCDNGDQYPSFALPGTEKHEFTIRLWTLPADSALRECGDFDRKRYEIFNDVDECRVLETDDVNEAIRVFLAQSKKVRGDGP